MIKLLLAGKKLATKIIQANLGTLIVPYKVLFVVTKSCQSRCQNCRIWQEVPKNEMSLAEIKKFAQRNPFLQWLNLTGGEPTDREDLPEIVETFLAHCKHLIFVNFATNGLRPQHIETVCRKIQALKPLRFVVTVSIDGPPDLNDRLRGVKGDFAAAVDTFARLRKAGIEAYVGMTLYEQNHTAIAETVSALSQALGDFQEQDLHLNLGHSSAHYFGNTKRERKLDESFQVSLQEYLVRRGSSLKSFEWLDRSYLKNALLFLQTGRSPMPCAAMSSSLYVSEHGTVYPCSIWDQPLGSLRDHDYSLLAILQKAEAKRVKEKIARLDCPNCWTPCEAYPSMAANVFKRKG